MKKLLLMLCMVVGIGMYSMAKPTTWESKPTDAAGYDSALEGSSSTTTKIPTGWWIDKTANTKWDLTAKYASGGYYFRGTNGLTFGSGSAAIQTVTLETSAFPGTITNVTINGVSTNVSSSKKGNVTATVTVGTEKFTATTSSNNTATAKDFVFTGSASGKITIVLTQAGDAGRQLYFKGLAVTYDTDGGDNPPVTTIVTPPTITINGEKQGDDYLVGATATISAETEMIMYTLDGTTPTAENGELYTEAITLNKAQKYTIKAVAFDNTVEHSSIVTTEEVNVVEKTVTPPAGDSGTVVYYADGFTLPNKYDVEVKLSGSDLTSSTWTATNVSDLKFYANSSSKPQINSSVCRWYTKDKIEITPAAGIVITGLKMVTGTSNSVCANNAARLSDINNTAWTAVSNTEATWSGKLTNKFEFSNTYTAQIRFQYLEVTYEKVPVGPVVDKPVITITGEKSGENYLIGATASISAPNASYIFYTTDGSDPKAEGNAALEAVEAKSVDLGTLSVGPTTIQAYVWDAEGNESDVASMTVNVVKKPAELAWSKTSCTVYMGEEPYDLPTLTHAAGIADNEISYSIPESGANVATINQETGEISIVGVGSTTVRATYTTTEESEYASSWVQYTLNVVNKASIHETRYLFDFTINDNYGLTTFSSSKSGFETDTENPVTKISRKGVTLDFIIPEGDTGNSYRLWDGATTDLRIHKNIAINLSIPNGRIVSITFKKGNNAKFALIPEKGTLSGIQYINNQVIWKATEGESVTSIKFTSKSDSEWNNSTDGLTQLGGIEVVYDLGKPAMPYVVSEDESQIVIACDDYCVLHYTKVPHNGGAQAAPSRAALAGTGKDLVDSETWYDHEASTLTIDKTNQSHVNRGYTFTAYHGETDMRSDALNILVDQSGTLTGVEGISAEADADAPVEFYDLQGRKVANPQGGIFIRRQGNKVTKVAL